MHVHVTSPQGEAKFWLEPVIRLDQFWGLNEKQLNECQKLIEKNYDQIKKSRKKHFAS